MLRNLSARLVFSTSLSLLLLLASVASTFLILQRQADDGVVVNLAGRQRMLTQRMTHQLLAYSRMKDRGQDAQVQRQAALQSMQVFEVTLASLDNGGPAPLDLQLVNVRMLPAASLPVSAQISRVRQLWEPYHDEARALLDGSAAVRESAERYLTDHNTELLNEMNSVVSLVQAEAETRVQRLYYIQGAAVALGLLLTLTVFGMVRRGVVEPLRQLNRVSDSISRGHVHTPVEVQGPVELEALGASVERLRVAMKNLLPAAEAVEGDFHGL